MTWSPPILNQWGVRAELLQLYKDVIDPTLDIEPMTASWSWLNDPHGQAMSRRISHAMARCIEAGDQGQAEEVLVRAGFKPTRSGELFRDAETIRNLWTDKHGYRAQRILPVTPVEHEPAPMPCGLCSIPPECTTKRTMYRIRCGDCGVQVKNYNPKTCVETWNCLMARKD